MFALTRVKELLSAAARPLASPGLYYVARSEKKYDRLDIALASRLKLTAWLSGEPGGKEIPLAKLSGYYLREIKLGAAKLLRENGQSLPPKGGLLVTIYGTYQEEAKSVNYSAQITAFEFAGAAFHFEPPLNFGLTG